MTVGTAIMPLIQTLNLYMNLDEKNIYIFEINLSIKLNQTREENNYFTKMHFFIYSTTRKYRFFTIWSVTDSITEVR